MRADAATLPVGLTGKQSPARWAMMLFILNEAAFFAYLLFSYFYVEATTPGPWPSKGVPGLELALPNTLILLASSGTMWWGETGARRGRAARARLGLLLTFLLGAIFLCIQALEYSHKPFTPAADAYASLFYTITGFHGAHVAVGLLMNLVVQVWAARGSIVRERSAAVSNVAVYWHFVDAVWLAVFAALYLLPRIG